MLLLKKLRFAVFFFIAISVAFNATSSNKKEVPADIKAVFDQPLYKKAIWGLRVIDLDTKKELINLKPQHHFFIASVRKVFSIGQLLNEVGSSYQYNTPVYSNGQIDSSGVLQGDLILVASGDLTMGGRTNPDGSIAFTEYDHNEAYSFGNSLLTAPDPLAGYSALARQVAQAGIKEITGNIIIDDRLFQPFNFRGEFNVSPIFVNDDMVDLTINPTTVGSPASMTYRPNSSALNVKNALVTGAAGSDANIVLDPLPPKFIQCIGQPGCTATISGKLPVDFIPPLTQKLPFVQAFRITQPSNYARTVFIEALISAGIKMNADSVANNPVHLLPAKDSYNPSTKVTELQGLPFAESAKLILKVSYNLGADTSLVLFGLTQGVDNISDALKVERKNLKKRYAIADSEYDFTDGSGDGNTWATNNAVVKFLMKMQQTPAFPAFLDALPQLGVDGSLGSINQFKSDPTLAGAEGQVRAKTGTYLPDTESGPIKGAQKLDQALGGYITTKSGRRLVFQLVVNDAMVANLNDVIQVFQDQGIISAMLWRDY